MQEIEKIKIDHKIVDLIEFGHVDMNIVSTNELKELLKKAIPLDRFECCQMIKEELIERDEWD